MKYTGKLGKMLLTSVGLSHNMWMMYCEIKWDLWLFFLILKKSYANWCCVMLWVSACCISYAASPGITWWYPVIFGWILRQAVKRIQLEISASKAWFEMSENFGEISPKFHLSKRLDTIFHIDNQLTEFSVIFLEYRRYFGNYRYFYWYCGRFPDISVSGQHSPLKQGDSNLNIGHKAWVEPWLPLDQLHICKYILNLNILKFII